MSFQTIRSLNARIKLKIFFQISSQTYISESDVKNKQHFSEKFQNISTVKNRQAKFQSSTLNSSLHHKIVSSKTFRQKNR